MLGLVQIGLTIQIGRSVRKIPKKRSQEEVLVIQATGLRL